MIAKRAPATARSRLLRTLWVPIALAVGLSTILFALLLQYSRLATWTMRGDDVANEADHVQKLLLDGETGLRGYLVTGDDAFLEPYARAIEALDGALARLASACAGDTTETELAFDLARATTEWRGYAREMIALRESGGGDFARVDRNMRGKQLMDGMRDRIGELLSVAADARAAAVVRLRRRTIVDMAAAAGTVVLLGVGLSIWAYRRLTDIAGEHARLTRRIAEDRFRVMVENVRDYAIFQLDPNGIVESWNVGAARMKGYAADEIVGRSFEAFYTAEDVAAGTPRMLLEKAEAEGRVEVEGWRVRKDGSRFWADVVITALFDDDGGLIGFAKVTRDMTQIRARERALVAANTELESFAYSVSHDLRAPLRAIDGFSAAIIEDYGPALDGEARRLLDRIRAASQRMGQLIEELLRLSRITRMELRLEVLDVTALCRTIVDELRVRRPGLGVEVQIADRMTAVADPQLARIAFENLLENAWKFVGKTQHPQIEVGQVGTEIFVRDNGAGFDPAHRDRLFSAFQRLHRQDEFEGTGIGLATVKRIVARHGGHVRAEGAVGKGATFYLDFGER